MHAVHNKTILSIFCLLASYVFYGQSADTLNIRKQYGAGFFLGRKPTVIYGIAAGPFIVPHSRQTYNGLTLELVGTGIIAAFGKGMDDSLKMGAARANGLVLSAMGSVVNTNGFYAGGFGLVSYKMNGMAVSLGYSDVKYANGVIISGFNNCEFVQGLQIGAFSNATNVHGLQIGLTNTTKKLRGIQLGVWNVNERRKLPFINWNFGPG